MARNDAYWIEHIWASILFIEKAAYPLSKKPFDDEYISR